MLRFINILALVSLTLVLCSAIALAAAAANPGSKIAPYLAAQLQTSKAKGFAVRSTATFPVLIVLKEQADLSGAVKLKSKEAKGRYVYQALRKMALKTQGDLVTWLKAHNVIFQRFYITNMIAIENASADVIKQVAARGDVAKVFSNPNVLQKLVPTAISLAEPKGQSIEANISAIKAPDVWNTLNVNGKGIVVAGQDTGVQWDHPALKSQYRGFNGKDVDHAYNWHDAIHKPISSGGNNPCGYDLKAPCDDNGHGTHTMGTVVGDDGGQNKVGVAPGAQWIACRNMDSGTGRPTTYIECFEFFLAPYVQGADPLTAGNPAKAPHIINNSWSCEQSEGCEGSEMREVMNAMALAGIMVVVSAGNEGPGCSSIAQQPAQFSGLVLSVGAHNHRTGNIASFSSRGPSKFDGGIGPDVTAPGVNIRSAYPKNLYAGGLSGTSMAGPHVAGEVALMWSAAPTYIGNIKETIEAVHSNSSPTQTNELCGNLTGASIPNNTFGYGQIDALKAVQEVTQHPLKK